MTKEQFVYSVLKCAIATLKIGATLTSNKAIQKAMPEHSLSEITGALIDLKKDGRIGVRGPNPLDRDEINIEILRPGFDWIKQYPKEKNVEGRAKFGTFHGVFMMVGSLLTLIICALTFLFSRSICQDRASTTGAIAKPSPQISHSVILGTKATASKPGTTMIPKEQPPPAK